MVLFHRPALSWGDLWWCTALFTLITVVLKSRHIAGNKENQLCHLYKINKLKNRGREREKEIYLAILAATSISSSQGFLRGLVLVVMFQQVAQTTL